MDRKNFASDDDRLRALIHDMSSGSDNGTLDMSFISEYNEVEELDDDVPTTDDDEEIPSEPDDTDEDKDYVPSEDDDEDNDDDEFVCSTPKKSKYSSIPPGMFYQPRNSLAMSPDRSCIPSSPVRPILDPVEEEMFDNPLTDPIEELIDDPPLGRDEIGDIEGKLVTGRPMFEPHSNPNVDSYVPPSPIRPNEPPQRPQYEPFITPLTDPIEELIDDPPLGRDEIGDIEDQGNVPPEGRPIPNEARPNQHNQNEPLLNGGEEINNPNDGWDEIGPEVDFPLRPVTYQEVPGPKHMPPADSPPIRYFNLFFTTLLFQSIVRETNRYAEQCLQRSEFKEHSRVKKWLPTCIPEMKGFIACILNMGLIRKPTIFSYWSTNPTTATLWFRQMFARDRFQLLLRFFHLVNNDVIAQRPYDPCAKFQPIVDHANILFRHYYTPHEQLSVDESLIGTKSHTVLQQYLPKKQHHRWGVKVWMLCDSVVNYVLGFYVYKGKIITAQEKQEQNEFGQGFVVVKKLLTIGNYLNKGFHVFTDNFFASIPLASRLYELGTYYTATIRSNRKGLPAAIKEKFDVGVTKFFKKGFLLLCGHRDKKSQKKQVLLISSSSQATRSEVRRRVRRQADEEVVMKPDVILEYNKYMGGIDISDMMVYAYLDERRTVKLWKKVVFSIFSRMVLNSYILYKENVKLNGNGRPMNRYKFMENLVQDLGREWIVAKTQQPAVVERENQGPANLFGVKKLPGRKLRLCKECSTEDTKHRSAFVCVRCDRGLHPECIQNHRC
jgi:hypothetical protein